MRCKETLYKEEDTRGTYTPDGCSKSLFYVQLSHILIFQTLLLLDSTSSITWSRNIVIDLQSQEETSIRVWEKQEKVRVFMC